jgi:hypothetical protein
MTTKREDKGYQVPDCVAPGAAVQIAAYIPDDPLYIAAFWSAYEYFTTWLAWQRDSEHRGAMAADEWKVWFMLARDEWERREDIMDVRQNPTQPCKLEKRLYQCPDVWIAFADLTLCAAVIEPPTGEDEGQGEIMDVLYWFKLLIDRTDELLDEESEQGVSTLQAEFFTPLGAWQRPSIQTWWAAVGAIDDEIRDIEIPEIAWNDAFDKMFCRAIDVDYSDPTKHPDFMKMIVDAFNEFMTEATGGIIAALYDLCDSLFNDEYFLRRVSWFEPMQGKQHFDFETPSCEEGEEWEQVFDFKVSPYDWYPFLVGGVPRAVWIETLGWGPTGSSANRKWVQICHPLFTATHILSVQQIMSVLPNVAQQLRAPDVYASEYALAYMPPTVKEPIWYPAADLSGFWVSIDNSVAYTGYLSSIKITGIGENPWA